MLKEKYRPQYHFSPLSGWMNDPNGLVFFRGEYHLFYQHNPYSCNWGSMHWGHAVSNDLLHWRHLPVAYRPETEMDDYFSGSSIVDNRNVSGFFKQGEPGMVNIFTHRDNGIQQQSIGYSQDGRHFTRYPNCVLVNPGLEDFRDPKVVWVETKKCYMMALAVYDHVALYTSRNLKEWRYYSAFGQLEGKHRGVWECPDLFELPLRGGKEKRWVLMVSDQGLSKTQYFVGSFQGRRFVPEDPIGTHLFLDAGTDNYAGQTYSGMPDGRCVMMAWLCSPHLINCAPTAPWRSALTVPRELWLEQTEDGVRLFQRPVEELKRLRGQPIHLTSRRMERITSVTEHISSQFDLEMTLDVLQSTAAQAGVQICCGKGQEIDISYDLKRQMLCLDRSHSGEMGYAPEIPRCHEMRLPPVHGKIGIRVLLDHSTLEIFDLTGRAAMTAMVFPDPALDGVRLYARDGFAFLDDLWLYPIFSVWEKSEMPTGSACTMAEESSRTHVADRGSHLG